MAGNRMGTQTIVFPRQPRLIAMHSIVGPMEGRGPMAEYFHEILPDDMLEQTTPEKAEKLILEMAIEKALNQKNLTKEHIQYYIAGDLLNQIISATFSARSLNVPYIGIYGACSSFAEGVGLAAVLLEGGFAQKVLVGTSSHYQTAERQYRYPIELNVQHKVTSQHTVTGAGAVVISIDGEGPKVTHATFGKIVDMGVKDPNDMGSAMAPAAFDTISRHLEDTGRTIDYYDLVLTGDLGLQGLKMLRILAERNNTPFGERVQDGGVLIYNQHQGVGAGGSGCACSAVITLGYVNTKMYLGELHKVLIVGTGALLNSLTALQGESIPCIAHAIALET